MPLLDLDLAPGIATLTLRNPARRNALSWEMLRELDGALARVEATPDVRVVLLTGEGDRVFSAGGDVREWGACSPERMGREWIREGNRVFRRLAELDAVVICLLEGDALGGGLELALAPDMRLAVEGVRLGCPEVGIGAVPGWLGCARLQALIGPGRARQMILTGVPVDAALAERWGLVNELWPREALRGRADEIARAILSRSPVAVSAAKRLLNLGLDLDRFAAAHELAATACRASPDAEEGLAAFAAKRPADYSPVGLTPPDAPSPRPSGGRR
jgi:enoyl-CoA hydratase